MYPPQQRSLFTVRLSRRTLKASYVNNKGKPPEAEANCRQKTFTALLHPDLREDAGSGGHSAVHHAVENGEQAVQREGLRAQEVVTRLSQRQIIFSIRNIKPYVSPGVALITFSFFFRKLVFFILPWCCWDKSRAC